MLQTIFFEVANRIPDAFALWVEGCYYTFAELAARARRIAGALVSQASVEDELCLLFAYRSMDAYAGMLGILSAGMAYVPLHPRFPAARNAAVIARSGARLMVVDRQCVQHLEALLPDLDPAMRIVVLDDDVPVPDAVAARTNLSRLPREGPGDPLQLAGGALRQAGRDDLAYMLFTSGSTGAPKGVMTTHGNVIAYVAAQASLYPTAPGGRYSQFADLSFDFSTHDIYTCWYNAGCLYVPELQDAMYLAEFIREHELTHWAGVPSVLALMQQFRKLSPNVFPSLRMTLLGGEALPKPLAVAWKRAAPNTRIVNGYGPTETTVIVLTYELDDAFLADDNRQAVPLGRPYPGVEYRIVDESQQPVAKGEQGELVVGGPQVGRGYIGANPVDEARFIEGTFADYAATRWYRTGDAVSQSDHGVMFHGRLDTQVKIRGQRIELQEIEQVVQDAAQSTQCAVLAWPLDPDGKPVGLIALVPGSDDEQAQMARIRQACQQSLPVYAQPERIVFIDRFPINSNGKIDRRELMAQCDAGLADGKPASSASGVAVA